MSDIERTFRELESNGKRGYFDIFTKTYVKEKDAFAYPERYYEVTPEMWNAIKRLHESFFGEKYD